MPRPIDLDKIGSMLVSKRDCGSMFAPMPELESWLRDVTYTDGTLMPEFQLSIRPRGVGYLVQLKVAGPAPVRLQVEDTSLELAFLALEHALSAPVVPWEPDPYPLGGTGKKKK